MSLPEDVRKAVEAMDLRFTSSNEIPVERASIRDHEWATIKAHLLAREAEVERLNACIVDYHKQSRAAFLRDQARAERAEALLRECRRFVAWASERLPEALPIYEKLDAHLSENSRG